MYTKRCEIVENIKVYKVNILIVGDFNLSGFPWSDYALYDDPIFNVVKQTYHYYFWFKIS